MKILKLIENTGNFYKKVASTAGGEYKGPCPWCGGEDRFSIHPEQNHYVCRHCKRAGDAIQFYRDYHNMDYHEACYAAGQTPNFFRPRLIYKIARTENWNPRETKIPSPIWQNKAEAIAFTAFKYLMSAAGKQHREYLHARGLSLDTIKKARLGWINTVLSFDPAAWGLPSTGKNIWIPRGIIIPYFHLEKGLLRLRIRQNNPITNDRYILVAGSSTEYLSFPCPAYKNKPVYITEAELDGWLCWQEFGNHSLVMAIGNSSTRPDKDTHKTLVSSSTVLLGLDNDAAGQKETDWWKRQYKNAQTCGMPKGKDPGEAFEQGVDLKQWFAGQLESRGLPVDVAQVPTPQKQFKQTQSKQEKEPQRKTSQSQPKEIKASVDSVKSRPNKICLHRQYCVFLRESLCTIAKQTVAGLDACPKDKWWLYKEKNSPVSQIILGPGVKKI